MIFFLKIIRPQQFNCKWDELKVIISLIQAYWNFDYLVKTKYDDDKNYNNSAWVGLGVY